MTERLRLVRTSERSDFVECRMRWKWGYVDRLKPTGMRPALTFGDLVHQALAAWYIPETKRTRGRVVRGPHPADTFMDLYKKMTAAGLEFNVYGGDEQRYEADVLGVEMLNNYIEHYGKDEQWFIIMPEVPFQFHVYHPVTKRYLFTYVGTGDAIARHMDHGRLMMVEHKTAKALGKNGSPNHYLPMDEQSGSYLTYLPMFLMEQGLLTTASKIDHVEFNFLKKSHKDQRPQDENGFYLNKTKNKDGSYISKNQPGPLFYRETVRRSLHDRKSLHERVKLQVLEMEAIRNGKRQAYKSPSARVCKGCAFRDMCELHEAGEDWEFIRDNQYSTWDPYDVHEMVLRGELEE